MTLKGPAPRPCESCPYRRDVPSGVWSAEEYEKLRGYDEPMWAQPCAVFQCHQTGRDDRDGRLCAGWVGVHGDELLILRIGVARGHVDPAVWDYSTDVPLFGSGTEAAEHGERDIEHPSGKATAMVAKILAGRDDVRLG